MKLHLDTVAICTAVLGGCAVAAIGFGTLLESADAAPVHGPNYQVTQIYCGGESLHTSGYKSMGPAVAKFGRLVQRTDLMMVRFQHGSVIVDSKRDC